MDVKNFAVSGKWVLLIQFPAAHERVTVESREGQLRILRDKCNHRGGPLHLCYQDSDGVFRCPWHDRKVLKRESFLGLAAVYVVSRGSITLVSSVGHSREWPVQVLER